MTPRSATDILLLYFYRAPLGPTVMEHLGSFARYSGFQVQALNLADPASTDAMRRIDPQVIVLHYTLFGMQYYLITEEQAWIVGESRALKAGFFQDEYHRFPKRCQFIDEYGLDMVYTLIEPQHFRDTYYLQCKAPTVLHTLAGYVSEELQEAARRQDAASLPRDIDVGYRGHELDIIYGLAGQEKRFIGQEFKRLAAGEGLILDVETSVDKRIYGEDWHRFIGRCKAMLGVEAGVSAFDLDDSIRREARALRRACPDMDGQELWRRVVAPHEDNVPYRMISPRHFEAAALGTCQILFEGRYSGVLLPDVHYIELKKDFSNLDAVLAQLRDRDRLREIRDAARSDLVDSGAFSYREFIADFDRQILLAGIRPSRNRGAR